MSRFILLVFFLVAGFTTVHAQYLSPKTNPLSLLFGVYKLEVEASLGGRWAIQPEVALVTKGQRFWSKDYNSEGYRFGMMVKRYFTDAYYNERFYGFAYFRHSPMTFTDLVPEGEMPDQRDFKRNRRTFGFGIGYTSVGNDNFVWDCSVAIGRHSSNDRQYTSTLDGGEDISRAYDETIFETPLDVYARIGVGVRIFQGEGLARKVAADDARHAEWDF